MKDSLLKSKDVAMKSEHLSLNGARIHLRRAGTGAPLLFLHGAGGVTSWLPCFDDLAKERMLLVPDHPGFGIPIRRAGCSELATLLIATSTSSSTSACAIRCDRAFPGWLDRRRGRHTQCACIPLAYAHCPGGRACQRSALRRHLHVVGRGAGEQPFP